MSSAASRFRDLSVFQAGAQPESCSIQSFVLILKPGHLPDLLCSASHKWLYWSNQEVDIA